MCVGAAKTFGSCAVDVVPFLLKSEVDFTALTLPPSPAGPDQNLPGRLRPAPFLPRLELVDNREVTLSAPFVEDDTCTPADHDQSPNRDSRDRAKRTKAACPM